MATRPTNSSFALVNPIPPEVPKIPSSVFSFTAFPLVVLGLAAGLDPNNAKVLPTLDDSLVLPVAIVEGEEERNSDETCFTDVR
jgi:hypothetical protein